MNVASVLFDILVVLVAAKVAAELAERVRLPAVVGEILAGILVGPSVLDLVSGNDVLRTLGELGVILLLFEVGLEMDLGELAAVGRASLSVATIGVVVPLVSGSCAALALGMDGNEALFVGAALTATSVGITARVFGDLRALATVEARTVLGAAVADDVMGLVILTVVVRIVETGSVSVLGVVGVVAVAVVFLVLTTVVGTRVAPPLFEAVHRLSRSPGTMVALALAFTLALAELADAAQLAPIVGAFVAGLALGRSTQAPRIRRELAPVGHLFIPVFFLQVGMDVDLGEFVDPAVLGIAGVLLVIAVAGKVVSALGMGRRLLGDRLLVGLGMIPRGEVGLLFASLGLRQAVFGEDVYAALILVVLLTTLVTPPALRWRLVRTRARAVAGGAEPRPAGGWLTTADGAGDGVVELAATPPVGEALLVALEAARACERRQPGQRLLDFLSSLPEQPLRWDARSRQAFLALLDEAGPRAWRFLSLTGVLDKALPEIGAAVHRRQTDPGRPDPTGALDWPRLSRLRELDRSALEHPERVALAAIVLDATEGEATPAVVTARRIANRLGLGAGDEQAIAGLVADVSLLLAAARRPDAFAEERVLALAVHLGAPEQARALTLLTLASGDADDRLDRQRLAQLADLVVAALARPNLTGRAAANAVTSRRTEAQALVPDRAVRERIEAAPRAYVLSVPPDDLARQSAFAEPRPLAGRLRVQVRPAGDVEHVVDVVAADRLGLLAGETAVLEELGLDVRGATVATWGDGTALASFRVTGGVPPAPEELERRIAGALARPPATDARPEARIRFEHDASPWHTVCHVVAPDHRGLLHAVTAAFAAAGVSVHAARISGRDGLAVDEFDLSDGGGAKLDAVAETAIVDALAHGVRAHRPARARWRRRFVARRA